MQRILVLRGGALGDFIVTLPALAMLRRRWPSAQIELAGNPGAGQLAFRRGLLDAVHSQHEARWAALFGDEALPADLGRWLAGFDLVVNYWPDPDDALSRHFPLHAGQRFVTTTAMPSRSPAAAHYCEPLRALGIEPQGLFLRLEPLDTTGPGDRRDVCVERDARLNPTNGYIAVHPGSGSRRKNWPRERWQTLIAQLPTPVSLILGEAELAEWKSWAAAPGAGAGAARSVLLLQQRPLEELIAHFARCRLFLGHDSGVSHLAAACGVPSVLLFGPTDPAMWAPPAPEVRVLRCGPEMNLLSHEDVRRAVDEVLAGRR